MKIRWKLRMAAAQREVWTGAQLRRLLAEKAGLELSAASVSALLTKEPAQMKLSTLAALCTALECTPNDLFEVDTTPVARPSAPPRPEPTAARPARARPVDAAAVTGAEGETAARLRAVRSAGRVHRPGVLLQVLAQGHRGRRQGSVPGVRQAACPARPAPARACSARGRARRAAIRCGGWNAVIVPARAGARRRRRCASDPARAAAGPATCAMIPAGAAPCSRPVPARRPAPGLRRVREVRRHPALGCAALLPAPAGPPCSGRSQPDRPAGGPARPGWASSSATSPPATPRLGRRPDHRPGRLLDDEGSPASQALLERSRRRRPADRALARVLGDFFSARGLALPTDQADQLWAARRQRRVDAVPGPLRPGAAGFCQHLLHARDRARRAGTRPRADKTIERRLRTIRDMALFLTGRGKNDWATADVTTWRRSWPPARRPPARLTGAAPLLRFGQGRQARAHRPHPRAVGPPAPRLTRAPPPCSACSGACSAAGPPATASTRTRR